MTKADLIEEVSRTVGIICRESEIAVDAIFNTLVGALRRADKVQVRGFGSFQMRQRQSRVGRNPRTGARVEVPPKKIARFVHFRFWVFDRTERAGLPQAKVFSFRT